MILESVDDKLAFPLLMQMKMLLILLSATFPQGEKKKVKKTKTEKYWDWELTNETKPIWVSQPSIFLMFSVTYITLYVCFMHSFLNFNVQMRNPKEVEKDQYQEFYKKTFNEFLDPLSYTHFTTEV